MVLAAGRAPADRNLMMRYPRESVAVLVGLGAATWIVVNALVMQKGPHPSPIFAAKPVAFERAAAPARDLSPTPRPVSAPAQQIAAPPMPQPRRDPIADLIAPPQQVMAVQRALSEFGYGQIRVTGAVGPDTRSAIERFERQHHMAVTGEISDALLKALSTMTGEPLR